MEAQPGHYFGSIRRRRERKRTETKSLKGPRTSDLEGPRDRESESRKTRKTADLCQNVQSPTTKGPRDQSADVGESRKAPTS